MYRHFNTARGNETVHTQHGYIHSPVSKRESVRTIKMDVEGKHTRETASM